MRPRRPSRDAGFSLPEMMIALGLASIVSAGLLILTRTQLQAFQQNDQVNRAQQNARAGMSFVESILRRSCGGMSQGTVALNVPGVAPVMQPCVRFFDGVTYPIAGGSFTAGSPTTGADAIEVVYGYGALTANAAAMNTAALSVSVYDTTGFVVGDFVLVTEKAMQHGALFKLASITPSAGATPGTLTFAAPGGAILTTSPDLTAAAGNLRVLRAKSLSIYVDADNSYPNPNLNALMLDPNGMAGADHLDAEPLIENVGDFQLAIGFDTNTDGTLTDSGTGTDEWVGNAIGESAIINLAPGAPPTWNVLSRQIRAGVLVRTSSTFSGAATTEQALENRPAPVPVAGANPRWRPLRMVVAPRAWNLAE